MWRTLRTYTEKGIMGKNRLKTWRRACTFKNSSKAETRFSGLHVGEHGGRSEIECNVYMLFLFIIENTQISLD